MEDELELAVRKLTVLRYLNWTQVSFLSMDYKQIFNERLSTCTKFMKLSQLEFVQGFNVDVKVEIIVPTR